LTDGIDTRSRLTSDQVSTIASTIDIPVYIVAVVAMIDDPRQTVAVPQVMTGALPDLAKWTGGEMFVASWGADPEGARFLDFFQIDKNTGDAKGIVAIDLGALR